MKKHKGGTAKTTKAVKSYLKKTHGVRTGEELHKQRKLKRAFNAQTSNQSFKNTKLHHSPAPKRQALWRPRNRRYQVGFVFRNLIFGSTETENETTMNNDKKHKISNFPHTKKLFQDFWLPVEGVRGRHKSLPQRTRLGFATRVGSTCPEAQGLGGLTCSRSRQLRLTKFSVATVACGTSWGSS